MNAHDKSTWPQHEDGSNKRMCEMTADEKRGVWAAFAERVAAQFGEGSTQHRSAQARAGRVSHVRN